MIKGGQISLFFIIGFVILVSIGLFASLYNQNKGLTKENDFKDSGLNFKPVEDYITDCLKVSSKDAIKTIELQGGYYYVDGDYLVISNWRSDKNIQSYDWIDVPYYMDRGIVKIPSIDEIKEQLESYINTNIDICLNNFSVFREQGYEFELDDHYYLSEVVINDKDIVSKVNSKIKVLYKESSKEITSFSSKLDTDLKLLYVASIEIVNAQKDKGVMLCLSCIAKIADKNNQLIALTPISTNDTVIISVSNKKQDKETFNFLVRTK